MGLVYVRYKWLAGERLPANGTVTCFNTVDRVIPQGLARRRGTGSP